MYWLAHRQFGGLTDARIEQYESERRGKKNNRQEGEVHLAQRKNKFSDDLAVFY
jgi:hypothetical protein